MFPGANTFVQSTYMAPSLINTASRLVDVPSWRHRDLLGDPIWSMTPRLASKTIYTTHDVSRILQVNPRSVITGSTRICFLPTGLQVAIDESGARTFCRFFANTRFRYLQSSLTANSRSLLLTMMKISSSLLEHSFFIRVSTK